MGGIRLSAGLAVFFAMFTLGIVLRSATLPETYTYDTSPATDQGSIEIASSGYITESGDPFAWGEIIDTPKDETQYALPEGAVLGASVIGSSRSSVAPAPHSTPLTIVQNVQQVKTGPGLSIKKGKIRCNSASDEDFGCLSPNDFENFSDKLDSDALEDSESLADLIGDGTGSGALVFGTSPTISALTLSGVGTSTLLATNESGVVIGTSSIAVQALSVLGSATTTFQHGINLATGCFAVNGVCVTGGGGGGGITDLNGLISTSQSFATTSDTNIRIAITSSGGVHTFTPSWNGALSTARGGTGTSTAPTQGQLLMGNGGGGYDLVSTSSLGFAASQWLSSGSNIYYQTGLVSIGTSTANAMLQIADTSNTTGGLYVSSSQSTPAGSVNLATFETVDANWDRPLVRINDVSSNGGAANIRLDSPNPDIEFIETDQVAPEGKFELAGSGNRFQINSRDAGNSAFETILEFAQKTNTADAMTLYMTSNSATRDAFTIVNETSSSGAQPGFTWRSDASSYDYARLSAQTGASSQNSKFFIQVADFSKQLQTRFVIDRDGFVGIGTTSPYRMLSVAGNTHLGGDVLATGTLTALGSASFQAASATSLTIANQLYDGAGSAGANGYVLQTTGSGITWVATSSLGIAATGGVTTLNGQTGSSQSFATSSNATGFGFTSSGNTHTFNIPTASASVPLGLLSSTDWTTFNGKQNALVAGAYISITGSTISATGLATTSIDLSSELAALLGDETGTGNVVFSDAPTFTGTSTFIRASTTALLLSGQFYDNSRSAGVNGMILQTTGSGVQWVATSTLGITSGNNSQVTLTAIRSYTASTTWSKPSGLAYIVVEVWGGGGGGGGGSTYPGGGGGGGGYTKEVLDATELAGTSTVSVIVGGGGAGGTAGSQRVGATGGTTYFSTFASSTGGAGGRASSTSSAEPGVGGSGFGGDIHIVGGTGYAGGTSYGSSGGGDGGDAPHGGAGGTGGGYWNTTHPKAGMSPGGGGGGAAELLTTTAAGADGAVVVYEYTTTSNIADGVINSGTLGQLAFYASDGTTLSGTSLLTVSGSNVSVGSTTPSAKLSVEASSLGTTSAFTVGSSTRTLLTVSNTGNVGIGTSSPWKTLSVAGSMSLTGAFFDSTSASGTNGMVLQTTGTGVTWVATSSLGIAGSNYFTNSGASTYLSTGSNLGIGTSTPWKSLSVVGDTWFTGNATATNLTATGTLTALGLTSLQSASTTALTISGKLFDASGTPGSAGMVLQTTGSGVQWVATSTLGISGGSSGSGAGYKLTSIYSTTSPGTTTVNFSGSAGSAASFSAATLTLPSDTSFIVVELIGGGGGGGGGIAGGGGGGGYMKKTVTTVASSYSFRVGAGGTGPASGNGGLGSTTSFSNVGTSTGGAGASGTTGGAGGTGSGGDVNISGGDGGTGSGSTGGGYGGSSAAGGTGGMGGIPTNGANGKSPGGGGAGGNAGTGGTGGNGGVIVHVYTPSSNVLTGTIGSGSTGQLAFYSADGTTLSGSSNLYLNTTSNSFGIGTTAPTARLSIDTTNLGTTSAFLVGSSTQTLFRISNTGRVSIGTTTNTDVTSGANTLTIAGASGSNVVRFANTGGSVYNEGSVYMLGNTFNGVQFGSLTNTGVGIFTNNGSPSLHVNQNGGVSLGAYADTDTGTIPPTDGLIVSGTTGIGSSTPSSMLTVSNVGSANSFTVEDALNDSSPFLIDASGNVSIGTTSSNYKLTVSGDILIANNANTGSTSTTTRWTQIYDGSTATKKASEIRAMAVYNGSLYFGIGSTTAGGAALMSYNGSTFTTVWQATSTYEAVRELEVANGVLYFGLGDSADGDAKMWYYDSNTATSTYIGDVGTRPYIDGIAYFNGKLFACTSGDIDVFDSAVYRYDGGTTWTSVYSPSSGWNGCDIAVHNGSLYAVFSTYSTNRNIAVTASGTDWTTRGTHIEVAEPTLVPVQNDLLVIGQSPFIQTLFSSSTAYGSINDSGAALEGSYAATVFNGDLYVGSGSSNGDGDVYKGFGARILNLANENFVNSMAVYDGKLYIATGGDAGEGDIYVMDTSPDAQNSYGLNFTSTQGAITSLGTLWFEAGDMFSGYNDDVSGTPNPGTFKLSHTLVTAAGQYDVAEDYPSVETDLMAGDILAFDPENPGHVRKARPEDSSRIAGALSARPGFLLSSKDRAGMLPMALVGRVPVQVSTEGGPIEIGDSITLSSTTAGIGMRAQFGDVSVGYALEPLPGGAATTSIMVYVSQNNALHMGVNLSALDATSTPETLSAPDIMDRLVTLAKGFVDGVLRVAGIRTDLLCVGETCVNEAQLIKLLENTNEELVPSPTIPEEPPPPEPPVEETGPTTPPDIPPPPEPEPEPVPQPTPEPTPEPTPQPEVEQPPAEAPPAE